MACANDVFEGPTITVEDDRRDYAEQRFITVGFLGREMVVVVVVWTPRGDAYRIISIRKESQ